MPIFVYSGHWKYEKTKKKKISKNFFFDAHLGGAQVKPKTWNFAKMAKIWPKIAKISKTKSKSTKNPFVRSKLDCFFVLGIELGKFKHHAGQNFKICAEFWNFDLIYHFWEKNPKFWSKTAKTPQNGPKYHFFSKLGLLVINSTLRTRVLQKNHFSQKIIFFSKIHKPPKSVRVGSPLIPMIFTLCKYKLTRCQ